MIAAIPRLTPDGAPKRPRKDGDTDRSTVDPTQDPDISGDTSSKGYANTGEATADEHGLIRNPDGREHPLI